MILYLSSFPSHGFTSVCPNSEDNEEALDIDLNIFKIFFVWMINICPPRTSHIIVTPRLVEEGFPPLGVLENKTLK